MNKQYNLIIFDVDGTLTTTKSGATFRKTADDWQWLPARREVLLALGKQGVKIAVATNQGGVAFGYMRREDISAELSRMAREAHIPAIEICYAHPKATIEEYRADSPNRKPNPGMLLRLMSDAGESASATLYVGDRPEDEQAAKNAGCDFAWADVFFSGEMNNG